ALFPDLANLLRDGFLQDEPTQPPLIMRVPRMPHRLVLRDCTCKHKPEYQDFPPKNDGRHTAPRLFINARHRAVSNCLSALTARFSHPGSNRRWKSWKE